MAGRVRGCLRAAAAPVCGNANPFTSGHPDECPRLYGESKMAKPAGFLAARAQRISDDLERVRQALLSIQHIAQTIPGGSRASLEMVEAMADLTVARVDRLAAEAEAAAAEYTRAEANGEDGSGDEPRH